MKETVIVLNEKEAETLQGLIESMRAEWQDISEAEIALMKKLDVQTKNIIK